MVVVIWFGDGGGDLVWEGGLGQYQLGWAGAKGERTQVAW